MQKKILKGITVSPGKATGFVLIVKSKKDFSKIKSKNILIINSEERIFINVINRGVGIIMNSGGITSHIAKISRELGKPCIILKDAIKVLKDGALLKMDGKNGTIEILKKT